MQAHLIPLRRTGAVREGRDLSGLATGGERSYDLTDTGRAAYRYHLLEDAMWHVTNGHGGRVDEKKLLRYLKHIQEPRGGLDGGVCHLEWLGRVVVDLLHVDAVKE